MPGPKYTIDTHPKRANIIKAIIKGESSTRIIAKQYGLSAASVQRYLNNKLISQAAKAQAEKGEEEGAALRARIETVYERMQKLYDACDEYLTDPHNPTKYTLTPHAHELEVIYSTESKGARGKITVMHKENLKTMIDKALKQPMGELIEVKYKHADPRRLIIEKAGAMTRQLEIVGKIIGEIGDVTVNITNIQQWQQIKAVIIDVTKKDPKIRDELTKRLTKITSE